MNDQEFKSIRHRFYRLGKARSIEILQDLGKLGERENPDHDTMKEMLEGLETEDRINDLILAIQHHEKEIQKEKEEKL